MRNCTWWYRERHAILDVVIILAWYIQACTLHRLFQKLLSFTWKSIGLDEEVPGTSSVNAPTTAPARSCPRVLDPRRWLPAFLPFASIHSFIITIDAPSSDAGWEAARRAASFQFPKAFILACFHLATQAFELVCTNPAGPVCLTASLQTCPLQMGRNTEKGDQEPNPVQHERGCDTTSHISSSSPAWCLLLKTRKCSSCADSSSSHERKERNRVQKY